MSETDQTRTGHHAVIELLRRIDAPQAHIVLQLLQWPWTNEQAGQSRLDTIGRLVEDGPDSTLLSLRARCSGTMCHGRACCCRCHKSPGHRFRQQILDGLEGLAGSLFLGYSGTICDTLTCKRKGRRSMQVTYVFPLWMIRYAIYATFQSSMNGAPSGRIIVRKRVDIYAGGMLYNAQLADLSHLVTYLKEDRDGVNHANYGDGRTALHYAVMFNNPEAVRILLGFGANPDAESDNGMTPGMLAATSILANRVPESVARLFGELFPMSDHIEELDLSPLIADITGYRRGHLASSLASHPDLNGYDQVGWTPLYWAAVCGNADAVKRLIRSGADVNLATAGKTTPLLGSLGPNVASTECFDLLLHFGADLHVHGETGAYPLHLACQNGHFEAVKTMVRAGVDVNIKTRHTNLDALSCAATGDSVNIAKFLIKSGVEINSVSDQGGTTALTNAVARNSHACIRLFLRHEADHRHISSRDGSLLHYVAISGDIETMAILNEHRLQGIDLSVRDQDGLTAQQRFACRSNASRELSEAFEALLDTVYQANSFVLDVNDDDEQVEDELYYDALEIQEDDTREERKFDKDMEKYT